VGNQDVVTSAGVAKVDPVGRAPLRSAASFSVLAGTDVVNTGGLTHLSGDLGVSPAGVITGFPPGIVAGDVHTNDAASSQALADVVLAYDDLDARTSDGVIVGDLGGQTFHAGVHHTSVALGLTGTVTLDAEGDPTAVFVFRTDAAFNTAAGAQVNLVNGAQAAHVFWQVQGAVGTGASTVLSGTILSAGAITLGEGTTLIGRALSMGTVTMANTTVRFTSALPPSITITGGSSAVTKDPTPTIAGTTTAPAGRSVTVTIGGQVLSATVQADGTWSVSAAELAAGTYPVLASVRDAAGNAGNATQTLVVEANPDPVQLGTAGSYSVLAATGVVNTGPTTVSGDLGVSPGTVSSISGFPPGIVAGDVHINDAAAIQAQADLLVAYDEIDDRIPHTTIAGDLGGQIFHAGVHHTSAALGLTGTVTLDAEGDPTAVFVFQTDAAFNTAAGAQVNLVNGAQAANVFWQVQGAVGTGASTVMSGTILSAGAITLGQGTTLIGRALSKGTVTMATTIVLVSAAPPPTLTVTGGPSRSTLDVTPTISGTTSAGAGRTVTVRVDGQVLSATVQGDGTWSVTAAMLLLGNHAVTASVRDAAGNAGAARQTLSISLF
jgi:cytochrome b561